jgi:hypothetical protein
MTEGVSVESKFFMEHTVESRNDDSIQSYSIDFEVGTNFFEEVDHRY